MNESKKAQPQENPAENQPGTAHPEGSAAKSANSAQPPGLAPEPKTADTGDTIDSLRLENAELKDKLLRTLAEMENLRRRTEREVAEAKIYGVTSFARDMLIFADNLRRALASLPESQREEAEGPLKAFAEGVGVIERDFLQRLGKHGVKKLEPLGAKFDPNLHEALLELPSETAPNGTVVQVIEEGYAIGDRVLRPAKVGVSRGAPKAANENAPP